METGRLYLLNWNLRNLARCAENYVLSIEKGGSPAFWDAQARRMDLDTADKTEH